MVKMVALMLCALPQQKPIYQAVHLRSVHFKLYFNKTPEKQQYKKSFIMSKQP